jgi:hypothetical protein
MNALLPISIALLLMTTASLLTIGRRELSRLPSTMHTAQKMEDVVRRYFDGVNKLDPVQIRSCFGETANIRDVSTSAVSSNTVRTVQALAMVERSMDSLRAHPDCKVDFYYGPEKGRTSEWVVAHWFETGRWSGASCAVEGQTRFLVDREALEITDMVVTRISTEWEERVLEKRLAEARS